MRFERERPGIPLGFKLMFGVVTALIVCIWILIGYATYFGVTNPEGVGRFIGSIVKGVEEGRK